MLKSSERLISRLLFFFQFWQVSEDAERTLQLRILLQLQPSGTVVFTFDPGLLS